MRQWRGLFAAIFLVVLLAFSSEVTVRVAEGRECRDPSQKFKGFCVRDRNCASVCSTEGFTNGHCDGLRRRCFCSRPCA